MRTGLLASGLFETLSTAARKSVQLSVVNAKGLKTDHERRNGALQLATCKSRIARASLDLAISHLDRSFLFLLAGAVECLRSESCLKYVLIHALPTPVFLNSTAVLAFQHKFI